ncbi:nuclear transition protein 2 [Equus przewalskii]|uniref:Nuclear transition protein 2 n=1 Tax=Equus przewalskii TaxID=9798 RepID=A0ABM4KA24_EQUPR
MDTKAQGLPVTHSQPHSNSRPQSHTCSQCDCSHHCQNCSQSFATGRCSQRSSPNVPKHHSHTTHSHSGPARPITHSCSYSKKRKNLKRQGSKRKAVKRSQRVGKTQRWHSGMTGLLAASHQAFRGQPRSQPVTTWSPATAPVIAPGPITSTKSHRLQESLSQLANGDMKLPPHNQGQSK